MGKRRKKIWFILGPSGVGKSSFGEHLSSEGWFYLEIDQFDKNSVTSPDGIDAYNLRAQWDAYYHEHDPAELIRELDKRSKAADCVLTFPGNLILVQDHIAAAADKATIIYLYGSAAHCTAAFLKREQETRRLLGLDHWMTYNCASHLKMSEPVFDDNRIHVFTNDGTRKPHGEVFKEIAGWS